MGGVSAILGRVVCVRGNSLKKLGRCLLGAYVGMALRLVVARDCSCVL